MTKIIRWTSLASFLGLAFLAQASLTESQASYQRGMALERQKDYQRAISEYQKSLAEYPAYFYSELRMGYCYGTLGDKAQALQHLDLYLAKKPEDEQAKNYAAKLRGPAKPAVQAPAPSTPRESKSGFQAWAGYATLNGGPANAMVDSVAKDAVNSGYTPISGKMGGGLIAGFDFTRELGGGFGAGISVNFIYPLSDVITGYSTPWGGGTYERIVKYSLTLTPFELGGVYRYKAGNFSLLGSAWAGYGLINGNWNDTTTDSSSGSTLVRTYRSDLKGGAFVWELRAGARYELKNGIYLLGQAAFRSAYVASVATTQDVDYGNGYVAPAGAVAQYKGEDLAFDFGGTALSIGIGKGF